jgi:streptogramin lyase
LRFLFPVKIGVVFLLALMIMPLFSGGSSVTPPAYGDATATLTEWTIPTGGSLPAGLALDPSGNCCWFVESSGNKVAHLDPSTYTFQEWAIPTSVSSPTSLALTTISGSVIVVGTESAKNKVFLFFPGTGSFREYTLPVEYSGPQYVSVEVKGTQINAWFTERKGNLVGELTYDSVSGTARVHQLSLPFEAGGGATGVHADAGIIWFAGNTAIVKWDSDLGRFTAWTIPVHPSTEGAFIDVDALGQIWYTSTGLGTTITYSYVGVLRSDNTFTEWQVPTVGANAQAISINPVTQSPWIAEHGEDKIAKLDPSSGGIVTSASSRTTQPEVPIGEIFTGVAGPVLPSTVTIAPATSTPAMSTTEQFAEWTLPAGSAIGNVVVDKSGEVWVVESSTNKVARLSLSSDFLVTCDPLSFRLSQGSNETSTCTVTSVDGFTSDVQLAGSWLGPEPSGVVKTLSPSPVSPPPGRGVSSTLIISASPTASVGTFTFQVNGTSDSLTHKVNLEVTIVTGVADFALTASPSYLAIAPGGTGTSTITVQSFGVFFSPVTLTVTGAPQGMTLVFGTNPVTPPVGTTTSSVLTVHVSGALQRTYALAIVGTDGSVTHSTGLTVQVGGGGPCLIATATYGSELSDEVQFLRNFRDKSIMKTNAGSDFMIVFNAWYYSFSPTVAQFIRENSAARTVTKFTLYPLMGILRLGAASFYLFPTNLEVGAILSGLLVSSLIGVVYVTLPLTALFVCSRRSFRVARKLQAPVALILFGALAVVAFMTVFGGPAIPMMIGTSAIVLASLSTSALAASRALLHIVRTRR